MEGGLAAAGHEHAVAVAAAAGRRDGGGPIKKICLLNHHPSSGSMLQRRLRHQTVLNTFTGLQMWFWQKVQGGGGCWDTHPEWR